MTIFEEILGLLSGSPELHAYLLARPEQLQTTDYADIISGAPIALTEKGRLLERLSEHMTHSEDAGLIRDYSACLKTALQALESKDAAFSAELWKDGEQLDGPYASTATLYILRQADSANASDASSDFSLALKVVNDCTYLLKSHTVLDEVISSLNLDMEYEDLYDCVSTSNPEDTRILEVTVKADSPELAKRIVDRICTIGSQRIEDAMGFQQVNLYELGTTDPNPCNSTRMITFAFAGIVAAVMMYVFFLIIFLLDDRIKADDENLERYLGLSVLGNIPNADGKKAGKYGYYKTYAAYKAPAKQEVEDK